MRMQHFCWVYFFFASSAGVHALAFSPETIERFAGAEAEPQPDGVIRISWPRDDVEVSVDGMQMPPAAGLGSWAAFMETAQGAMVMGDTVVFQDEVDAAMDAAFAHGLEVTALHNHFFYDEPRVYFMHIGGRGEADELASGVKAVWDAIKKIRAAIPQPGNSFNSPAPTPGGRLDATAIERITGLKTSEKPKGVLRVSQDREGRMHGVEVGGTMGLSTWAAFVGSDELAAMDGDFIMTAEEVQPVLLALRESGVHVVALHNHMTGEEPHFYFTHFWAVGPAADLAEAFKHALDVQAEAGHP